MKREIGLVVPGRYTAKTKRKQITDILSNEIRRIQERYPHFELEIQQDVTYLPVLMKQEDK